MKVTLTGNCAASMTSLLNQSYGR